MLTEVGPTGPHQPPGTLDMIVGYEERVYTIIIESLTGKKKSTDVGFVVETGMNILTQKKIIDSFLNTLLSGSVSPTRIEGLIRYGIASHDDFQELIAEVGTYLILSGESDIFLSHMMDYPTIFQQKEFVFENPQIQEILRKRIQFLEENGQYGVASRLRNEFLI